MAVLLCNIEVCAALLYYSVFFTPFARTKLCKGFAILAPALITALQQPLRAKWVDHSLS